MKQKIRMVRDDIKQMKATMKVIKKAIKGFKKAGVGSKEHIEQLEMQVVYLELSINEHIEMIKDIKKSA